MNLNELISDVKRENKIPTDDIFEILTMAIENGDSEECTYKHIYKKAYGEHLNESMARNWVKNMDVPDDSGRHTGEKWTVDQTSQIASRMGISWDKMNKWEWYAAMNQMYSDMYPVAKEYEVHDDPEYFACNAKAFWLNDSDAHDKTLFSYYFNYVV